MFCRRKGRGESGSSFLEYLALGVLAAVILAALAVAGLGSTLSESVGTVVCRITHDTDCTSPQAGDQGGDHGDGNGSQPSASSSPNATGTDNPNGEDEPTLGDLAKQADDAQKAVDGADTGKQIMNQIIDLLKDFIGITDIQECFTKGSISACLWAALDVGAIFFAALKIGKFAKAVKGAIKLFKDFNRARKALERLKAAVTAAKARYGKVFDRLAHACGGNSFSGGTLVVLANGRSRPISELRPGDRIRAGDPSTGRTTAVPVLRRIIGSGEKKMVRLAVSGNPYGLASATIDATANHPFWASARHAWVDAGALRAGDELTSSGGHTLRVLSGVRYTARMTVYNLSVTDPHTYFVRAGGADVLVHNTPPKGCLLTGNGPKIYSKTLGYSKNKSWRIDIENPVPGKPSANMHLQLMGRGAKAGDKFFYNPSTGEWLTETGRKLPANIVKEIPPSMIAKGLQFLGVP